MSRAREVSKVISTVQLVEDSIDNIDLSYSINTASAAAVAYLIDGAPAALNTLNELAAALNDNESFATTVTNELSSKLSISSASATYLPQTTASATYLPLSGGNISGSVSVSGLLSNTGQPVISGQIGSSSSFSAVQRIPFDDFFVQRGITYNSSTRRFTVPTTGLYRITMNPFSRETSTNFRVLIGVNTDTPNASNHRGHCYKDSTSGHNTLALNSIVSLTANDYIVFYLLEGDMYNNTSDRFNQFSIEMIG
jgi:hypothetical protein